MSESFSGTPILNVESAEAQQNQISGQQNRGPSFQSKIHPKPSSLESRRVLNRVPASDLCIEYGRTGEPLSAFQRNIPGNDRPRPQITRLLAAARAEAIFS